MSGHEDVLNSEVKRWSAKSVDELIAELPDVEVYAVVLDGKEYQVEVDLLENNDKYVHVMVAVDDGTIPSSFRPLVQTFFCPKPTR